MRDKHRPHLLSPARQKGKGSRWHARLAENLEQPQPRQRRLLGRLHHHNVSCHKGRGGHPTEDHKREVPGGDHHGHAAGQVGGGVFLTRYVYPPRSQQPLGLAGVKVAEVDRLGHVGVGLPPGLAHFEDLESGQVKPPGPHDRGGSPEDACPPMNAEGLPGR